MAAFGGLPPMDPPKSSATPSGGSQKREKRRGSSSSITSQKQSSKNKLNVMKKSCWGCHCLMPVFCSLLRHYYVAFIRYPCCVYWLFCKAIALMNVAMAPYSEMHLNRNLWCYLKVWCKLLILSLFLNMFLSERFFERRLFIRQLLLKRLE